MMKRWFVSLVIFLLMSVSIVSAQDGGSTLQAIADTPSSALNVTAQLAWPSYKLTFRNLYNFTNITGDIPTSCAPTYAYSTWHTFVAPYSGILTIINYGVDFDEFFSVYVDNPTIANEIRCENFFTTSDSTTMSIKAGTRYYVLSGAAGSGSGVNDTSTLTLEYQTNLVSYQPIKIPASGNFNFVQNQIGNAINGVQSFTGCSAMNYAVYYSFRPSVSGRYEFSTEGSTYDTVLALSTNGTYVACRDDISNENVASRLRVNLVAGQTSIITIGESVNADFRFSPDMMLSFHVRKL